MEDSPSPHAVITHPPSPPPRSNLPTLYYGLVVVGTAVVVLALYNFIIIKWCTEFTDRRARQRASREQGPASSWRFRELNIINFISSFKYNKDAGDDSECAVCLSAFEEGEELRQLPKCKHSFHAPCIDMWLYSHMDCPLCRSPVDQESEQAEHSREGLLGPGTFV